MNIAACSILKSDYSRMAVMEALHRIDWRRQIDDMLTEALRKTLEDRNPAHD